ncbi:MAG TPA: long-chain fatty acid--CoA ligase [Spirochaetota bacterium]|nr:long-chain fatty acid--CoA ligase [Spirochaetota bacterium]
MQVAERTINEIFRNRVLSYGDRLAVEKKRKGVWEQATWNQYYDRSRSAGLGLLSIGIKKGDRVSLVSENRLEWLYTDMGTLGIGAVLVPIYSTLSAEEMEFIIGHSESKVVIVENNEQMEKALAARKGCPRLEKIVVIEAEGKSLMPQGVLSFADMMQAGSRKHDEDPKLFEKQADEVDVEDLASIVYTSGTTGHPKGAMISHKNIMAQIKALASVEPQYGFDTDQTVPFLPLSHVFERIAGHFFGMYVGLTSSYAESMDTIVQDIQEKRPTEILAVPRVCEKVYQRITMQVRNEPAWKQKVFYWGQKVGAEISDYRERKKRIPLLLRLEYFIAFQMIFKKLQNALGGRVRWMTASGAPTAKEIIQFFNGAGIHVIEGYGMTELTAPGTMSNLADYRIGTVGKPLPGVDIKIDNDGEILVKGDCVVRGYWRNDEATREAFTPDGYLRTGDIGIFTEEGFLIITDRKKDIIITSGGKNVAPQNIENLFKSDPLFTQCIVIGERRKYLTALINVDRQIAAKLAEERRLAFNDPEELLDKPEFLKILDEHVAERNSRLARYETIKKYRIIRQDFSKESGELTATLKVKRKVVQEKYGPVIESMYADDVAQAG